MSSLEKIRAMPKAQILLTLLNKEKAYYEVLFDLTQQERKAFEDLRPLRELLTFTKKRSIIWNCIEEIERAMSPLKKHWEAGKYHSSPQNQPIRDCIHSLNRLLQQILEIDQSNQEMMRARLSEMKTKKPA